MTEAQRAQFEKFLNSVTEYPYTDATLQAAYAAGAADENEACAKMLEERGWNETARTIRARQEQGKEKP